MDGYKVLIPNTDEIVIGGLAFLALFLIFKQSFFPKIKKRIEDRRDFINSLIAQSVDKNAISDRALERSSTVIEESRSVIDKLKSAALHELDGELKLRLKTYSQQCTNIYNQTKQRCEEVEKNAIQSMKSDIARIVVDIVQRSVKESISEQKSRELTELVVDRFASKEIANADS